MAKPPDYGKIEGPVERNSSNNKRYKVWWDKEKQGFWNVYLDDDVTPVFTGEAAMGGGEDGPNSVKWWKRNPNDGSITSGERPKADPAPIKIVDTPAAAAVNWGATQSPADVVAAQVATMGNAPASAPAVGEVPTGMSKESPLVAAATGSGAAIQPEQPAVQDAPPAPSGVPANVGLPVDGPLPVTSVSATMEVGGTVAQPAVQQAAAKTNAATGGNGGGSGFPTGSSYGNPGGPTGGNIHTVVSKDTMWDIARANNMKLSELVALNPHIKDPHWIYPGDKINLGGSNETSVLGASTGGSGVSGVASDPGKLPLNSTPQPPDPFNGAKPSS